MGGANELKWRSIPGHQAHEVSENGDIRRCKAGGSPVAYKGRLLKSHQAGKYLRICLHDEGKAKFHPVSRIVAMAFHGPPPSPKHHAAHNDGNTLNNHYSNIRWATPKENSADRLIHGTHLRGSKSPSSKYSDYQIEAIREIAKKGISHGLIASAVGTSQSHVSRIVSFKNWNPVK